MRPVQIAATAAVVLGAFAALAVALVEFGRHPGLPSHIGVGLSAKYVAAGQELRVNGTALDARRGTVLDLWGVELPRGHRGLRRLESTTVGRAGGFHFVLRPTRRMVLVVRTRVDKTISSRLLGVRVY